MKVLLKYRFDEYGFPSVEKGMICSVDDLLELNEISENIVSVEILEKN
ncbi:MAG: hypothetical protein HKN40_14345 [Winogradskyella sp.]|nr:hypothetical protein [Winogradskyella sp.]